MTPIGKTSNDQMEDNDEEEDEEEDSESDHEDEDEEDVDMTNNFNQEDNVVNQWSKVNSAVTRMLLKYVQQHTILHFYKQYQLN